MFPSTCKCVYCDGEGGHHDGSRDHNYTTPWGWNTCDYCDGEGNCFSPRTTVIDRHTISIYWRSHEKYLARALDCITRKV